MHNTSPAPPLLGALTYSFRHPCVPLNPQGDIENVAAKGPAELTSFLEQVSGSEAYKARYEEMQAAAAAAEEKVGAAEQGVG